MTWLASRNSRSLLFRGKSAANLRLQKRANGNVCVAKLREIKVDSTKEACLILEAGRRKVRFCSSAKNQRGHCVFNIKLVKVYEKKRTASTFSFCDLACCTRQKMCTCKFILKKLNYKRALPISYCKCTNK